MSSVHSRTSEPSASRQRSRLNTFDCAASGGEKPVRAGLDNLKSSDAANHVRGVSEDMMSGKASLRQPEPKI